MVVMYRTPVLDEEQSAKAGMEWYKHGPLRARLWFVPIPVWLARLVSR